LTRERYSKYMERAGKKDYPLGRLLIAGLFLMELSGYRYATSYDRRICGYMAQIYGSEEAEVHLRLYWASRILYIILSCAFICMLAFLSKPDAGLLFFALVLLGCVLYLTDKDVKKRLEKKKTLLKLDFPDFVNRLALLINAGMTMEGAWKKIVLESRKPDSPLYRELLHVIKDIESGKPEFQAYEAFAKRCAVPEITRFVSVIVQNLRKGGAQLVSILRICAGECWHMRKNAARKMGEEASTKMLLPIMLIFIAIVFIAATPAMLALSFM
jgi:tight adherence protein C